MHISFVTQPYADGSDLEEYLRTGFSDPSYNRFDAAVAWAKRSGLLPLGPDMTGFRGRGGHIRLVIGISEGGATRQGLELAAELTDEAYVFHVRGRTFHSKVYAFSGRRSASVLVGSHNLTHGGLSANFEAATLVRLDLAAEVDRRFLADVRAYLDLLVADAAVCRQLDATILAALIADPRYRVGDEDAGRASSDSALGSAEQTGGFFGRTRNQLRSSRSGAGRRVTPPVRPRVGRTAVGSSNAPQSTQPSVAHRWFKQLPLSDAQRLPGTSSPSGHVTLTQARHPIDQASYFRQVFFAAAAWQRVSRNRERAVVVVDVSIMGHNRGRISLEVDHNPAFGAGQRNRVSTLRWGPLNDYLRNQANVVDQWLTLEAMSDGTYRLTVAASPTGPFIP